MGEVHHKFKRFVTKRLQGQDNVIDQQIPVGLPNFVSPGDVVKDRISSFARAGLVEDVQRLDGLELVLFVHVVLRHDLLELGAGHVHGGPPREVGEEELCVDGPVFWRPQVSQQCRHLVEWPSSHGLL